MITLTNAVYDNLVKTTVTQLNKEKELVERLAILQNSLKKLRKMKVILCEDGNWNYDPYIQGLVNGLIFALSIFDGDQPDHLDSPKEWLGDNPNSSKFIGGETTI
jgi:hypothetical protein